MENYGKAMEYTETAMNSSGEAMKKYEAYQDSLSGKLEGLKNSFIEISRTIFPEELLGGLIDLGTVALDILSNLLAVLRPIGQAVGVVLTGISEVLSIIPKGVDKLLKGAESFKKNDFGASSLKQTKEEYQSLQEEYKKLKELESSRTLTTAEENRLKYLEEYLATLRETIKEEKRRQDYVKQGWSDISASLKYDMAFLKNKKAEELNIDNINPKSGWINRGTYVEENQQKAYDRVYIEQLNKLQEYENQKIATNDLLSSNARSDKKVMATEELKTINENIEVTKKNIEKLKKSGRISIDIDDTELGGLIDELEQGSDEATKLSDSLEALSSSEDIFNNVKDEIEEFGAISLDSIQSIIDKYPELEEELIKYQYGLRDEQDILKLLQEEYDKTSNEYKEAMLQKMALNEDFYKSIKKSSIVQEWAEQYNLDLDNFKTLAELKLAIIKQYSSSLLKNQESLTSALSAFYGEDSEKYKEYLKAKAQGDVQLIKFLASLYSKYYSAGSGTYFQRMSAIASGKFTDKNLSAQQAQEILNSLKAANDAQKKITELQNSLDTNTFNPSISTNFNFGSSSTGSSNDDPWLEAFEKEYAYLNHLREMDQISTEKYYSDLQALNKKYFEGRNKYLDEYREHLEEVWNGYKEIVSERLQNSENWISDRNTYNDWSKYADSEIAAYKRILKWLEEDYYKQGKMSWKDYCDYKREYSQKIHEAEIKQYQEELDALESLYDKVEQMVRQSYDTQIDKLEDEKDHYADIIDAMKEKLRLLKEEEDANRSLAEKQKAVAKIEKRLQEIKYDTSASANAERLRLEEELKEAQLELSDYIREQEYESNIEALDKELEEYQKNKDDEIEVLEKTLNNAEAIVQETLKRLNGDWDELYKDLVKWNKEYGTGIEKDIADGWSKAEAAYKKYQSALGTSDFNTIKDYVESGANNKLSNSSSNSSSSSKPSVYKADSNGKAPSQAKDGDYIVTGGGVVQIINGKGVKDVELSKLYEPTKDYSKLDAYLSLVKKAVEQRTYSDGGTADFTGLAMLHGRSNSAETIFNATDSKKLYDFIHNNSDLTSSILLNAMKPITSNIPKYSDFNSSNSSIEINMPITVEGNLDSDTLPKLEEMINQTIGKLNTSIENQGIARNSNRFVL